MKITIVGGGYVGLVSGVCFATTGNHVTIADVDVLRIEELKKGKTPIYEPGLTEILVENTKAGRLDFTTDVPAACREAEVIGIAVGTPSRPNGSCNLGYVFEVAETIAKNIVNPCIVMTKSTVPVGTGKRIKDVISSATDIAFDYVSNPEFLKEGSAVKDFLYPERVIIGCEGDRAFKKVSHLYEPFMRRGNRILRTDVASAELAKYACNAMLATRISFMNELAHLAEKVGADIDLVRRAMGTDSRIGNSFLFPGLGYGGSCFPKDVQSLIHFSGEYGVSQGIVKAAHDANERQITYFFDKIRYYWDGDLCGKRIAIWGVAFKPQTDDVRESPAIKIIMRLLEHGAQVSVHDPEALENTRAILGDRVVYTPSPYQAIDGADGLVVCTEWLEYRTPDFVAISKLLVGKVVFDGRNIYSHELLNDYGLEYFRVG